MKRYPDTQQRPAVLDRWALLRGIAVGLGLELVIILAVLGGFFWYYR